MWRYCTDVFDYLTLSAIIDGTVTSLSFVPLQNPHSWFVIQCAWIYAIDFIIAWVFLDCLLVVGALMYCFFFFFFFFFAISGSLCPWRTLSWCSNHRSGFLIFFQLMICLSLVHTFSYDTHFIICMYQILHVKRDKMYEYAFTYALSIDNVLWIVQPFICAWEAFQKLISCNN